MKIRPVFRSNQGAIDLASIMVGIIVIGLIGGVISATIFVVIPWAQDHAAKEQLVAVSSAQNAHAGLSASGEFSSLPASLYGNLQGLNSSGLFRPANGVSTNGDYSADLKLCSVSNSGGKDFTSAILSDSGRTFQVVTAGAKPTLASIGMPTCLGLIQPDGKPEIRPGSPIPPPPPPEDPALLWNIVDDSLRSQIKTILNVSGSLKLTDALRLTNSNGGGLDFSNIGTAQGLELATNLTIINTLNGGKLFNTIGFKNLVEIRKDLLIENSQLGTFDGFENLRIVGERVRFHNNANMTNIPVLNRITQAGGMEISNLPIITNLNFGNLNTLGEFGLILTDNPQFSSYSGFNGVLRTDGVIRVTGNSVLRDLSMFSNMQYVKGVEIQNNSTLRSFNFNNLTRIGTGGLTISNMPSFDSIDGFGQLQTIEGALRVENNQNLRSLMFNSLSSTQNLSITGNGNSLQVSGLRANGSYGNVTITINGKTYNSVSSYLSR